MFDGLLKYQRAYGLLEDDMKRNAVRHAYIFEGVKGVGKRTAALWFSAALQCAGEAPPCGVCGSCAKHAARFHPDFEMLGDGEDKLSVGVVREIRATIYVKPFMADKKIYVINNADRMNDKAQNALLKVFEEPPGYGVLILLVQNPGNLLPTIRSRGAQLAFEPFPEACLRDYVSKKYPAFADKSEFISAFSGGVIGRAIDLCENGELFSLRKALYEAIALLLGAKSGVFEVRVCFSVASRPDGKTQDMLFDLFLAWFRDVLAYKNNSAMINADYKEEIKRFSAKMTNAAAINVIALAARVKSGLGAPMKYDLWITDMLIKCWEEIHGTGNRRSF